MADTGGSGQPVPGTDEIVVVKAPARTLCSSREHRRLGVLAEVIVTFGELGTAWQRDALWQTCWGRSYPLCGECWGCVRQVAEGRRPALVVMEYGWPAQGGAPPSLADLCETSGRYEISVAKQGEMGPLRQ